MDKSKTTEEPNDGHIYPRLEVRIDLTSFLLDAAEFYLKLLDQQEKYEIKSIGLSRMLTTYVPRIEQDREEYSAEAFIEAIKGELEGYIGKCHTCRWGNVSHGYVRYIKSMGYLYLQHLKNERNELAAQPNVPLSKQQEVDRGLVMIEEWLNQGVFANASLKKLLVEDVDGTAGERVPDRQPETSPEVRLSFVRNPVPRILDTVPILHPILRNKCMPILQVFHSSGQDEQLDAAVIAATVVFEDQLRSNTGAPNDADAEAIIHHAFDGQKPRIQLHPDLGKHRVGIQMYRGLFGFVRNTFQHHLQPSITPERVVQILGWIDYLLHLAESAERNDLSAG